jgi:hypothetical protein
MKTAFLFFFLCLVSVFGAGTVPPDAELKSMALSSLLAFNDGVQKKDFSDFYEQVAKLWQDQTTPEKLKEAFGEFIEKDLDISSVKKVQPVLEPSKINSDDVLLVTGYYPTEPHRVHFRLKYLEEEGKWKLVGINVDTKD